MRILITNLLAVALLLFGAASASAFAINMTARGATSGLTSSDTVIVDVFLDADPGIQLLSVGVLYPGDGTVLYDGPGSAALTPIGSGPSGAQPSYLLYTPASGSFMAMVPLTILYPQQTPYWLNWPAPPPGQDQVNINYAEASLTPSLGSGTGIYIATLVFHIEPGFTGGSVELSLTSGGNVLQASGSIVDPNTVPLSAPIVLTGVVPEPTTAMLIGLGVLGLAVAGRRRA